MGATSALFHCTQAYSKNYLRGVRAFEKKEYDLALMYLKSASENRPKDANSRKLLVSINNKLGRHHKVLEHLDELQKYKNLSFATTVWIGDCYYSLDKFDKAEIAYLEALLIQPDFDVQLQLAEVMAWQNKYDDAIGVLKQLPKGQNVTEFLADVYSWDKDYEMAAKLYEELYCDYQANTDVLLKLADALRASKKDRMAITYYKKYLELNGEL